MTKRLAILFGVWALVCSALRAQEFVAPNPEDIVVEIEVRGARNYREEQLIDALGHEIGVPVDHEVYLRGQETLWKAFHTRSIVSQVRVAPGQVKLVLEVYELPFDLEPRFVGNDRVSDKKLREWALIEERGEIYHHQVARVTQRLVEGYRSEGYYHANVRAVIGDPTSETGELPEGREPDAIDVIFYVQEGPIVRVKNVIINGNESLPDYGFGVWEGGLKHLAQIKLKPPRLLNWFGNRFVEDELAADLISLADVYRDKGFLDAVVELDRLEWSRDRSGVDIHIIVDEGNPYTVSELAIVGVRSTQDANGTVVETEERLYFDEEVLLGLCALSPGERYELQLQRADQFALREYFGERGYISHPSLRDLDNWEFLPPNLEYDIENNTVAVTYRIAQGRKRFIREVLFAGSTHTRDRVLRREVTQLPGQVADVNNITRSLQRIRNTSFFSDPSRPLEHRDPIYRFRPTEDPDYVDIEYIVDEGRVVDFQIAGGVDSNAGAFGLISLSMRNFDITDLPGSFWGSFGEIYRKEAFHGAGQRLDVQVSPGSQINLWRVRFLEPDLFLNHFERYSLDLELSRRERLFDIYDEDRSVRRVKLGRRLNPDLTVFAGFLSSDIDITDIEGNGLADLLDPAASDLPEPLLVQDAMGDSRLNAVTLDLNYNRLDSFRQPREGYSLSWNTSVYDGLFNSEYEFFKTFIKADWYTQLGRDVREVRHGIHLGLGAGVADPYGDTELVPFTERFFAGGFRTLRGFDFRGVGPNVGGNAIGGETFVHGTFEYRIPLHTVQQPGTFREIEMFRVVPFVDFGVLDTEAWTLDADELRISTGLSFGLTFPFPIVFNFGFPLKEGEGDDKEIFSFNLALQ